MLEHVVQTSSGIVFLEDIQNPTGCVPEQLSRGDLALQDELDDFHCPLLTSNIL